MDKPIRIIRTLSALVIALTITTAFATASAAEEVAAAEPAGGFSMHETAPSFLPHLKAIAASREAVLEAITASTPSIHQQVVDTACSYIGVPYRYGGASPRGFDCSGFIMYIYRQFGISLPHGASSQTGYGMSVARDSLKMGDLVFFRDTRITSRAASHVGIYIGGNKFIHAASSSTGRVVISDLGEAYWNNWYAAARRLLP